MTTIALNEWKLVTPANVHPTTPIVQPEASKILLTDNAGFPTPLHNDLPMRNDPPETTNVQETHHYPMQNRTSTKSLIEDEGFGLYSASRNCIFMDHTLINRWRTTQSDY